MTTASDNSWLVPGAHRDGQTALRDPRSAVPQNIAGVFYRPYPPVATGYGVLREMLRSEWLGADALVDQVFISSLASGAVSAWHAHEQTADRLFAVGGSVLVVLYDNRAESSTRGTVQEFRMDEEKPGLLIIPPRVWHGVENTGRDVVHLINAVDHGYRYEAPDHWRVPPDSPAIPYRF